MRCAGNADDVLVVGLDLWFNVFSLKLTLNVQCFLVESNSLLLKNGSFFLFFLFFLSASQMIYTKKLTMAINTDAANMRGWLGGAMVLCIIRCRGVLLHLHIVGQGPAGLAAGAGWVGCLFLFLFISSTLSSVSNASSLWRRLDILKYCGLGRYNSTVVVS